MSIERKPGRFVQSLVLGTLRAYMKHRSEIIVERNDTLRMKPPYLIVGNHVNNWDPLLINAYVKEPICFTAADPLFRHPWLRRLLHYTGAIPKAKLKADTSAIRAMLRAKQHRRVIGLFPEGNRNWDGSTEPLIYATAKLVRTLNIPVVAAVIKGGHLSHPRWAATPRSGPIVLSLVRVWDEGELAGQSTDSIYQRLTDSLHHDESAWQAERQHIYAGKRLAEHLERYLFLCPHCQTIGHMRSNADILRCQACGYTVRYSLQGVFSLELDGTPLYFDTPREWNRWQLTVMEDSLFANGELTELWRTAMRDRVRLMSADASDPLHDHGKGSITWRKDKLVFRSERGSSMEFPLTELEGVNVQMNNKMDFYMGTRFYRFVFYLPHTSAYKWVTALRMKEQAGGAS